MSKSRPSSLLSRGRYKRPRFRGDDVTMRFARGPRVTDSFAGQTVDTARRTLTARLKAAAIDSAELDARMLVGAALGLDLTGLIAAAARPVTPDESMRLEDFARRRLAGEPVARILGFKEFWGLPLQLSAATLVPRPDTETVVELALEMGRAEHPPRSPASHRRYRHRIRRDSVGAVVRIARGLRRRHRHQPGGVANRDAAMPLVSGSLRARLSSPATMRRRCRATSI